MKRLVVIISTLLILTGMYGGNVGAKQVLLVSQSVGRTIYHVPGANRPISIDDRLAYFEYLKRRPELSYALAVGTGGWLTGVGRNVGEAKRSAIDACERRFYFGNCKIKDVNGESDFIKKVGFSVSTSAKWVVRAGVYQQLDNAEKRELKLKLSGLKTGIEFTRLDGEQAYRLYVGPFYSEEEAKRFKSAVAVITSDKAFVSRYGASRTFGVDTSSSSSYSTASSSGTTLQIWGGTYTGEVVGGRAHGQGTFTHPNGEKYIGEWKDDMSHGQGTYTYPSGETYIGEFKDGYQWEGIVYLASGKLDNGIIELA